MTQFETARFRPVYGGANWCRFSLLWGVLRCFGLLGDAGSKRAGPFPLRPWQQLRALARAHSGLPAYITAHRHSPDLSRTERPG